MRATLVLTLGEFMKRPVVFRTVGACVLIGAIAIAAAGCSSSSQPSLATPPTGTNNPASPNASDGGNPAPQPSLTPVSLRKSAAYGNGVTAKILKISRAKVSARGPGEIAGPGIRVEVQITNGTAKAINLDGAAVTLSYGGQKTPATPNLTTDTPLMGPLAVGSTATATYNFSVPATGNPVYVQVSYTGDEPTAIFVGKV